MMNDEKLKEILLKTQKAVKDMDESDEVVRKAAFDKIFEFYKNIENIDQETKTRSISNKGESNNYLDDFWSKLSNTSSIPTGKLKDVYSINLDTKTLSVMHVDIKGENKKEKRKYLALLALLAYQNGFGDDWVSAGDLKRIAEELSLYDSRRFSQSFKSGDFRSIGKKKGTKYKLSIPGIQNAIKYLKEVASHTD